MRKIILFFVSLIITPTMSLANFYTWNVPDLSLEVSSSLSIENVDDNSNPLNLDCGSCILIESHTGKILYSYNAHKKLRPASITKIMSIYLIMESITNGKLDYNTKIPCSVAAESMGGSQIWLTTAEQLTVDELLKAVCVVSANDAVYALRRIYWRYYG